MTLEELGASLRCEREKRHLTIEDVASQLKINPRLLCALEAGDSRALPHPAYARGFIRSYASLLGFGNGEIQTWLADLQTAAPVKPKPAPPTQEPPVEPVQTPRANKSGRVLIAFIILSMLAGAGWWIWQSGRLPFPNFKRENAADIVNNLPGADTYQAARPPRPEPETVPEVIPVPLPVPAPAAQPLPEPVEDETPAREGIQPPDETPANDVPPEQHKLIIIATEECWVHSNADNTDTRQFSLRKGDTFALTFAKKLELKLGNAGGVRLRYDGNELPAPGASGQVRTLSFPPRER